MVLAGISLTPKLHAQTNADSARIARQRIIDSTRDAQKKYYDSLRVARQKKLDSTREAQKRYYDSMKVARQQKLDSTRKAQQRYNDSMRVARERKLDSTRKAQKRYNDSVQLARKQRIDSTREAQQRYYDSLRVVRQARLDSIKAERKRVSDSLAVIREYRSSDRYKDSVAAIRQARLDSIQTARTRRLDSMRAERKRYTDSIVAVRKAYVDSIKAVQKRRSDSLAVIREYRSSDRYKDSVAVVRKLRLDSIKAVRTAYYDSIKKERQRVNDSIAADRKAYTDSIVAERKAYVDSLKEVRQIRSDSLAKLKEKREKERKVREKNREEKAQLALELKIKKKREAWSNEKMLKKRWSITRRAFQNTFTRYNYYFNADQKMDEALENMQRFRQENYDSLLALYPFDPDRDSSVLASDMDSIIQKASVGIQIHDPRTKWGDDLYLLLGQAYYYKGDYQNAGDAFKYVVSLRDKRKKKKRNNNRRSSRSSNSIVEEEKSGIAGLLQHRSVHNEAILWLARTYTEQHQEGDAESVLDLIEADPNFSGSLEGRLALEKSYIRLSQKDYRGAVDELSIVSKDKGLPDWIRMRAAYINGQLLYRYGFYDSAAESFDRVLALHPKIEMDFYTRKKIASSLMESGNNQEDAIALLEDILKDGKYRNYYEQVYYLLGRLAASGKNYADAEQYLQEGINSSNTTSEQKAQSYATLGDVYYVQRLYEYAKSAYDSASVLANEAPDNELMRTAIRRSATLGSLTEPLNVISTNDSLLALAALSEKEQRQRVRKYIKAEEDRIADSIFQAQNAGVNAALRNSGGRNRKNNYANWYFTNPALMQKGYNAFKQKWGNRPLEDNWRRSATGGFADNDGQEDAGSTGNYGIPTEETLLAAIPNDPQRQKEMLLEIEEAYMDAADAYVKKLEDYPPGTATLDTLNIRFPNHSSKAEELYLRYIIALRQNQLDKAQEYSNQLTREYGDTEWAKLVKPTEDGADVKQNNTGVVAFYDETYSALLAEEYQVSLRKSTEGQQLYSVPVYKSRFMIVQAISLAKLEQYGKADSVLSVFMQEHTDPNDSLRRWAEATISYVAKQREMAARLKQMQASANKDTASADTTGGNVATVGSGGTNTNANIPTAYKYDAQEAHYVIISFPKMETRARGLRAAVDDFNKFKFGSLNLSSDIKMLTSYQGVVSSGTFRNKNQALIYMNSLKKTKQIFSEYANNEYQLMMISESNYQKLLKDKDFNNYSQFYRSKY